jgi:hypothetical protein
MSGALHPGIFEQPEPDACASGEDRGIFIMMIGILI